MKKYLFLLIGMFLGGSAIGQTAEKNTDMLMSEAFVTAYNQASYEYFYALLAPKLQQVLPYDKLLTYFDTVHKRAGNIKHKDFYRYTDTGFALYKVQFDKKLYGLYIFTDSTQQIQSFRIGAFRDENLRQFRKNISNLKLPFDEEWTVVSGGPKPEGNVHINDAAQLHAFDWVIKDAKRQSYKTDGLTNEDYYAFKKQVLAPCDGQIYLIVDGIQDNKPGTPNLDEPLGNYLIIETPNREFIYLTHFFQNSIKVIQNQEVKAGQVLGLCGNSGSVSEPTIHFHLQNVADVNIATGVKCHFEQLIANHVSIRDYSPIQHDVVSNKWLGSEPPVGKKKVKKKKRN